MLCDWLGHQIIVLVAKVMMELLKNSVYIATRYNYLKCLFSCAEYMTEKYNIKEVYNIRIIRKDKGNSHLRRVWKNVEECMCYACYSYDYI